ncbi:hypothetical protein ACO0LF_12455 [Undibacterium sp. Di27W]|uniref:hypothetical protein n=1 Tax=Undibacterium sp. Di27W TaxID=3413036 RepID=UPI003BF33BFC
MSTVLELKIKALVEGLNGVTALAQEITGLGESAKTAGANASAGKQGFTELSSQAEAYKAIGVRSFAEIRAEIAKVTQAHQQLTNTGELSGKELQSVTNATRSKLAELHQELKGVSDKASDAAGGGGALNKALGLMAPEAAAVTTGIGILKDNVGALMTAFIALAVSYGLKESAEYAARTETLGITMNVVAKNAGYGAAEIGKYEKEVKGLGITTQGTREAITQMIQAGLEIGPKAEGQVSQVAKLARAAQDLAVVTGENSSATLTRLITNISQLDTVGLRYMGLTVNVEAAERQFALSIGKTVEQLTQKQKAQAVMDESLKQAEKLQGSYEASMDTVGKKVQSLKRYQEELANDIGTKLLPAYGALVDAATRFLKDADRIAQGIDKSGAASRLLAEGVSSFGNAMGGVLNTVLGMVGEIYPSIAALGKGFMELLGFVIKVGTEILTLGHYTDASGNKITVLGQILKFLIGTIALVLAGLKDGIDLVTATIFGMGGAALDIIGKIISGFGKLVGYVNKDWGKAIQGVGDGLQATGKDMIGFADQTVSQFARGESAVGKYRQSLRDAAIYQQKLGEVTDFSKAEAEVLRLAEAVRQNGTNTKEFTAQAEAMNGKLRDMQAAGQLSAAQLDELQKRLQRLSSDDLSNFSKAVNEAGLKVVELAGKDRLAPLNKEFDTAKALVAELGSNTKATSATMADAFSKGVDASKTLAELNQIGASLGDVKKATGDIKPALAEVGIKFDELFEKALKTAKTDKDFADLRAEVERLAKAGTISGEALARALKDIEEKSKGAEAAMARLAQQAADMSRSNADLAKAHLDLVKAQADVGRANLDVLLKQNEYRKSGSELAKEELNLAKINKQLATEKATEAKLAYQVAVDSQKLLISLQQKVNAEKEVELHLGKEDVDVYKDKAKGAADAARQAEEAVNWSRSELSGQQAIVSQVEEKKVKQELVRDTVKETNVAYDLNRGVIEQINSSTSTVAQSQTLVTGKVNDTKTAVGALKGEIEKTGDAVGGLITKFDKAADAAGKVKVPGAGSGNVPPKPAENANRLPADIPAPKNETYAPKSNASKERYTGLGPVGKDDVTTSDGEHLRYTSKGHYENEQGVIVDKSGKASSTASDGFGAAAMDNDIANMLFDAEHGKKIEPTAENKQRAQTAWNAAKANKEMYDANSTAFSSAGADSIMRSYNRAKTLADSMGINTSEAGSAGINDGSGGTGGFAAPGGGGGGFYRRVDGSHKGGLDRVPKDGYVAELHEDEKVLTAPEAANYRNAPTVSDLSRQLLSQITFPRMTDDPAIKELAKQSARPATNQRPEKVIQVNLTGGGKTIPVTTDASNERALLDILKRAKGTAS